MGNPAGFFGGGNRFGHPPDFSAKTLRVHAAGDRLFLLPHCLLWFLGFSPFPGEESQPQGKSSLVRRFLVFPVPGRVPVFFRHRPESCGTRMGIRGPSPAHRFQPPPLDFDAGGGTAGGRPGAHGDLPFLFLLSPVCPCHARLFGRARFYSPGGRPLPRHECGKHSGDSHESGWLAPDRVHDLWGGPPVNGGGQILY